MGPLKRFSSAAITLENVFLDVPCNYSVQTRENKNLKIDHITKSGIKIID